MITPDIGQQIRNARKQRGISQLDLFELTGLSLKTISDIETGKTNPRISTYNKIAEALDAQLVMMLWRRKNVKATLY